MVRITLLLVNAIPYSFFEFRGPKLPWLIVLQ